MNQPGKSLGVVGLGGLGHMAVKFGKAFGLNVTIISTSESKREEAIKVLKADKFVVSSDEQQMQVLSIFRFAALSNFVLNLVFVVIATLDLLSLQSLTKSLDFIIDTASGDHPFDPYLSLLKIDGVMVLVGFPSEIRISPLTLNFGTSFSFFLLSLCINPSNYMHM